MIILYQTYWILSILFSKKYQVYWIFVTLYNFFNSFLYIFIIYRGDLCGKCQKKRINRLRKASQKHFIRKKITQSQLGEALGIAQNSLSTRLSRYEIGYDKMMDIANALGYEINLELVPIVNKSNADTNITTIPVFIGS